MTSAKNVPIPATAISDVKEIAQILTTRRLTIALITCTVALLVTFWTLKQPKIYAATCTLEYDPDPPRPLGSTVEDPGAPVASYLVNREWYETQSAILNSTVVAERVVRELQLHRNREFLDIPSAAPLDATVSDAAKILKGRLTVKGVPDTRLVEVRVEDFDRARAALIANSITETYLEKSLEDRLGSTQRALEWLSSQLASTNKRLQSAENSLQTYKLEHDVLSVSFEDRQNIIANEIERFSQLLIEARRQRIEISARVSTLKSIDLSNPVDTHVVAIDGNPDVQKLRADFREMQLEQQYLSATYGPTHPSMDALNRKLVSAQARIAQVIQGVIQSTEAELAEVKTVESELTRALTKANSAGHELNREEIEYKRLDRERRNTEGVLEMLLKRSTEADLARALKMSYARVADPAVVPDQPVRPRTALNILMGIGFGLLLSVAIAFSMHRLDSSVRSVDEAEAMGLPVLGIVPSIASEDGSIRPWKSRRRGRRARDAIRSRDLIVHSSPRSSVAECCRTVRTNLAFTMTGSEARSLVVTSPSTREGKSTIALSLAITLAQSGRRVLLVDTDLRKPRLHRALHLSSNVGVTSVMLGDMTTREAVRETSIDNLSFLASGPIPPNPAELLQSATFRSLVADVQEQFELVVFDSPPLTAVVDAAIIGTLVGGVVVVAHARRTSRHSLASVLRQLRDVEAKLLGGVINDVNPRGTGYGYAYGGRYYYHSGTYYGADDDTPNSGDVPPHASESV